jgi:hypothetical protein
MTFFGIAASVTSAVSFIALAYVGVPRIRRWLILRSRGVPALPRRAFPRRQRQADSDTERYLRELGRRRLEDAMGIEDVSGRHREWP